MAAVIISVRRRRLLARDRVFRDRHNPMDCFDDEQLYSGMEYLHIISQFLLCYNAFCDIALCRIPDDTPINTCSRH